MDDQNQSKSPGTSEEIDLGQLFQMFKRLLNSIFRGILRIFLYLRRNSIKLAILLIVGVVIGFLLKAFGERRLKTEVIVKPNFESTDYLYDAVEEIQSKINYKDTLFFKNLKIDVNGMKDFVITIEPIEKSPQDKEKAKENNDYLDILQNYKDNDFVLEAVRSEVLKKAILTHRITFSHRNPIKGEEYVAKLMDYINANPYFNELKKVYSQNAIDKIERNKELIKQIDGLVDNYTEQLAARESVTQEGMLLLEKEKSLDVTGLLSFKNGLIREIEKKQIEEVGQRDAISIINFGKTQVVQKQFLNKTTLWVPVILLGGFFLWSLVSYLNKKAEELV